MYQEDYLLRMIRNLVAAVARLRQRDSEEERLDVEGGLKTVLGLSIDTLDALPAQALISILSEGDDLAAERLGCVVVALEGLAEVADGPLAEARRAKASALRTALASFEVNLDFDRTGA